MADYARERQKVESIQNRRKQELREKEQQERLAEIKKIQAIKQQEKEQKQYEKDLLIACKNDLKAEFEKLFQTEGTKAKYYFYNVENRGKTINNILLNYEEKTIINDYLDTNYIRILNEIDKKYKLHEEAQEIQKQEELKQIEATQQPITQAPQKDVFDTLEKIIKILLGFFGVFSAIFLSIIGNSAKKHK